jgi:hypothetical protein
MKKRMYVCIKDGFNHTKGEVVESFSIMPSAYYRLIVGGYIKY